MVEHYYSPKPAVPRREREIRCILRGREYLFVTDSGVFSKSRIDPGTELLIEAMTISPSDIVLDLGCGYGPIGIVAAGLAGNGRVYLVDVNERACELARGNIERNGVMNAEVRCGEGFSAVNGIVFDAILSNPPIRAGKAVVYGMVEEAAEHLRPGGRLWMVARTKQGARSLRVRIEEIFGNAREVEKGGGYRVICAEK
ncbi:MAG TPA: class I SAM-dependent methyltransferase [Firmicutes bacterium]|nr:class I SAM-dependent methyltransferase [Bacillota bacterium]